VSNEPSSLERVEVAADPDGPDWDLLTPGRFLLRRVRGAYTIDEWGLDHDVIRVVAPFGRARWLVDSVGLDHLPHDGPALLVHNQGWWYSELSAVSASVHRATGRVVRFVGLPDVAPFGPLLRRMGGILDRPEEVRSVLRAGHLVSAGAGRERGDRRYAGEVRPHTVLAAIESHVPIVPVAAIGVELGLHWKVVFGEAIEPPTHHDPLAATALADRVRRSLQHLLDEHGRNRFGLPF
jgi:hypothetical protein